MCLTKFQVASVAENLTNFQALELRGLHLVVYLIAEVQLTVVAIFDSESEGNKAQMANHKDFQFD